MILKMGKAVLATAAALVFLTSGLESHQALAADAYPDRVVRMITPYPPGGPTDIMARLVAIPMSSAMGQQVIVDNRPGASGMIGAGAVAHAKPDGYTILANASIHVINPAIYAQMPYDSFKDFVPITQLAEVPLVLLVPAASTIKSVKDLVAIGRANPTALNFGSAGNASAQQLSGESFKIVTGISMQHVPYKGSAPALSDLMGGQIQLMFDSLPSAMPFIKSGALRAVAVTTQHRVAELPGVPTVAESGYPTFNISTWYGLWAPRDTPPAIVATLAKQAAIALKTHAVAEQYAKLGATPVGSTPEEFAAYVDAEGKKWAALVKASGLLPQ